VRRKDDYDDDDDNIETLAFNFDEIEMDSSIIMLLNKKSY
jgi:hypothetical protein